MHLPSIWGLLIVAGLFFLLFSKPGRISNVMEDLGKGIRGFRKGLVDPEQTPPAQDPPQQVSDQTKDRAQN